MERETKIRVGDRVLYVPTDASGIVSQLVDQLACVIFADAEKSPCIWVPLASLRPLAWFD